MLRSLPRFTVMAVILVLAGSLTGALADEIRFGDGKLLKGKFTTFKDGTLEFTTDHAVKIIIPVDQIQFISTEDNVKLQLTTGSTLTGRLLTLEDGQVAIIHAMSGGTVPFKWEEVNEINKTEGKWMVDFFLGGLIQSGNTEEDSINTGGAIRREWASNRFNLRFLVNYTEKNEVVTDDDAFMSIKLDHFFDNHRYALLSTEVSQDEFKDISLRVISGAGLGYRFWKGDTIALEFEAGLAYFIEELNRGEDDEFVSGRIGSNFEWDLIENLAFQNYLLYYPKLNDFRDYRVRNEASLISRITKRWALRLTYLFEQNSNTTLGVVDIDNRFMYSLQFSF